jgi:hypothetical protein
MPQPGLLKSLFSKMLSPFKRSDDSLASPEKIARRLTAGPAINDQDVFGDLERGTAQMNGDVHRDHKAGPSKERLEKQVGVLLIPHSDEVAHLPSYSLLVESGITHRSHPIRSFLARTHLTHHFH